MPEEAARRMGVDFGETTSSNPAGGETDEPPRVAVVGTGSMGQHHVRVYAEMEGVNLVGIHDVDEERADQLAEEHDTRAYSTLQELLAEGLNIVNIAVPTSKHHEVALEALNEGVDVLMIEKPISNDFDNAASVIARAREQDAKIFVGHIERFNPAIRGLKRAVEEGELGRVLSVANLRVGQYNLRVSDTGIIMDLGSHDIDLISYLLEQHVERVSAVGSTSVHDQGMEDHASILLKFPDNRSGICELSWLSPYKVRNVFVTGEERFALVDLLDQKVTLLGDAPEVLDIETGEPLQFELEEVVRCYTEDKEPLVSGKDSVITLKVCNAAIEAYKTDSTVEI